MDGNSGMVKVWELGCGWEGLEPFNGWGVRCDRLDAG